MRESESESESGREWERESGTVGEWERERVRESESGIVSEFRRASSKQPLMPSEIASSDQFIYKSLVLPPEGARSPWTETHRGKV